METDTMKASADVADERLFDNWFDPIETALRTKVRGFIETLVEENWRRRCRDRAMDGGRSRRRKITRTSRLSAIGMVIGCDR